MDNAERRLRDHVRVPWLVLLTFVFGFALFGLAGSLAVAVLERSEPELIPRFLAKAAAFGAVAALAAWAARRVAAKDVVLVGKTWWPQKTGTDTPFKLPKGVAVKPEEKGGWPQKAGTDTPFKLPKGVSVPVFCLSFFLLAGALVFPRLDAYPWAAPDEVHHLVVARNVATLGEYASGHPGGELRRFDPYDSVGPPVILPVALALKLGGTNLAAGRVVMGLYFILLLAALYAFLIPRLKPAAAAMGVVLVTLAFGSVYLGRTLYGEVPALAWTVLGLLLWRKALGREAGTAWGLAAGLAFGLAVLCKTILILAVFPFLAVLFYDRLTFRCIGAWHVFAPAAGVVCVVAAWWAVQAFSRHDVAEAGGGTLALYKHYLMFGLKSVPGNLAQALLHPLQTIPPMICMIVFMECIFKSRYEPPLAALYFIGVFYAAWWIFFTPGTIHRYLWFSAAVSSLAAAPVIGWLLMPSLPRRRRFLAVGLAVAIVLAPALRFAHDIRAVYAVDETGDDYAVSQWAAGLPAETGVAATWPVSGTMVFLADRNVDVLEKLPAALPANRVFIIDTMTRPEMLDGLRPVRRFGRYAVVAAKE